MKNPRKSFSGKNPWESQAYTNFLRSKRSLDKTGGDSKNVSHTDESSFDEDSQKYSTEKNRPKSLQLKLSDFFRDHVWGSLISSFILALLLGGFGAYVAINRALGVSEERVRNLESQLNELKEASKESTANYHKLKEDLGTLKIGIEKDIEFIKEELDTTPPVGRKQ